MSTRNSPLVARRARSGAAAILACLALVASLFVAAPAVAAEPAAAAAPLAAASAQDVSTGVVKAAPVVGFDPENIISDALFYDGAAMTAAEIQAFLDAKIGRCENGKCLNVIDASISDKASWSSQTTGQLVCSAIKGGTMKVAELIYRMQTACGISAKVILVTLQKEQGLVTSKAPSDWNLQAAMGASCPDTAPCDPAFKGVGPQIFKGTQQLKTYKATRFARQPGVHFIGWSPNSACGGTNLNIRNYATAALYNYTPYQPNKAALNAGYGIGDGCSSYGNRNFYNYYTQWFGSTQGSGIEGSPVGSVDNVSSAPGEIRVSGWSLDPESAAPIDVHVYVDGVAYRARADLERNDLSAHYPGLGVNHGFAISISTAQWKDVDVCTYGINIGLGGNRLLGCTRTTSYGGSPLGYVDQVSAAQGTVSVSGWAIDPDTADPITVHVYVGPSATAVLAGQTRADVASSFPLFGSRHGYAATVAAPAGYQTVCVYGINVRAGGNQLLAPCTQVFVRPAVDPGTPPVGALDSVEVSGNSVTVAGWALDPDTPDAVRVHVYVGAAGTAHQADATRKDVGRAYPGYGDTHGFAVTRTLPAEGAQVCVYAINDAAGSNTLLGCRFEQPQASKIPLGNIDSVTVDGNEVALSGWALDPDTDAPIQVHAYVGAGGTAHLADRYRADLRSAFPGSGGKHGFEIRRQLPAGGADVCLYAINDGTGANLVIGCRFVVPGSVSAAPFGVIDSIDFSGDQVSVRGWAVDPDTSSPIAAHIYVGGRGYALIADVSRPDVVAAYPASGPSHGFSATVPLPDKASVVCVYAINDAPGSNTLLGCRSS